MSAGSNVRRWAADREAHRARLPWFYSGWLHLLFSVVGGLTGVGVAVGQLSRPTVFEVLVVPTTLFIANLVEWAIHRGLFHRLVWGFGYAYRRHTLEHHHMFPHHAMQVDSPRDWSMVLFPPQFLVLFFLVVAAPIGAIWAAVVSWNAAWLHGATAMLYFVVYEVFHLAYHLPADGVVGRLPGMKVLRRLHTSHHDLRLMAHHNFNVTVPLADRLFGTFHDPRAQG